MGRQQILAMIGISVSFVIAITALQIYNLTSHVTVSLKLRDGHFLNKPTSWFSIDCMGILREQFVDQDFIEI